MVTRACLILLLASAARAQLGEPIEPDPKRVLLPVGRTAAAALPGSWRLYGATVGGFAVSAEDPAVGDEAGAATLLENRLRVAPALVIQDRGPVKLWRLATDLELHVTLVDDTLPTGLDADERWQFRDDQPVIRVTRLYALAAGEHFVARLGLDRSQFGLGILANAGEDAPSGLSRQSPFGVGRMGDRVLRAQVTVLPFGLKAGATPGDGLQAPLALALAGDAIIEDDTAAWFEGDRALQVLGGIFSQFDGGYFGGGLAHRRQKHTDGGDTQVTIGLLTAGFAQRVAGVKAFGELEAAGLVGDTTFVQSAVRPGEFLILSAGGALRTGIETDRFNALLEAGFASGDANGFDDELHGFTFDRDYRVGLLMFSEALRTTTAITAHNISDPRFRGRPPRGYDQVATGGALTNARYLNPRGSLVVMKDFTLHVGYLFATTDEPYVDVFRSGLAGGSPVGPRGATEATVLGHELDLGLAYEPSWPPMGARVRLEAAWFMPGEVFDTAAGEAADDQVGGFLLVEGRW